MRRVIAGESVPAQEKLVSIFETHTDIIRKDRRDTYYGHKICVTGGASNLILDCVILEGNPADSESVHLQQSWRFVEAPSKGALTPGKRFIIYFWLSWCLIRKGVAVNLDLLR